MSSRYFFLLLRLMRQSDRALETNANLRLGMGGAGKAHRGVVATVMPCSVRQLDQPA